MASEYEVRVSKRARPRAKTLGRRAPICAARTDGRTDENQRPPTHCAQMHQAQLDAIEEETKRQPPIGPLQTLADVRTVISRELLPAFDAVIARGYRGVRAIRGDGNCFFRALMFCLCRQAAENPALRLALLERMRGSLDYLEKSRYTRVSIEWFHEVVVEHFEDETMTPAKVEALFADPTESQNLVWYARLLCAGYLKQNADRFMPFIADGFADIDSFCAQEVEPVGREAEQVHIIALCEFLTVEIAIEYVTICAGVMNAPTLFEPSAQPVLTRVTMLCTLVFCARDACWLTCVGRLLHRSRGPLRRVAVTFCCLRRRPRV